MKRSLAIVATSVTAVLTLGAGSAYAAGNGQAFKTCFGTTYGQSIFSYGQFKDNTLPGHQDLSGYGLPGVLAAHGPDGAYPLCSAG